MSAVVLLSHHHFPMSGSAQLVSISSTSWRRLPGEENSRGEIERVREECGGVKREKEEERKNETKTAPLHLSRLC